MTVTIFHGPTFGHAIELVTETKGRPGDNTHDSIGSWHGVGIPAEVLRQATTLLGAAFEEHCIMRYGVQESLEGWEVEPDPF
jgi:hypothetical protein